MHSRKWSSQGLLPPSSSSVSTSRLYLTTVNPSCYPQHNLDRVICPPPVVSAVPQFHTFFVTCDRKALPDLTSQWGSVRNAMLGTLLKVWPHHDQPVMTTRPHSGTHPHQPRKYPPWVTFECCNWDCRLKCRNAIQAHTSIILVLLNCPSYVQNTNTSLPKTLVGLNATREKHHAAITQRESSEEKQ